MQKLTIDRIHVHLFHTCNQLIMGYFIEQFLSICSFDTIYTHLNIYIKLC